MAGSRLEYISTIFSRTTGLLRTKAIKYEDRPIWYDVYRVFPPKLEPRADRVPELSEGMTEEVPSILYGEDIARAALFKKFGKNPGGKQRNLMNVAGTIRETAEEDNTKRFMARYNETKSIHNDWTPEQIVESISQDFVGTFGTGVRPSRRTDRSRTKMREPDAAESVTAADTQYGSRKLASSSPLHDTDDVGDDDLDDGETVDKTRRAKRPIITAETLMSMFQKAKENKDDPNKK